MISEYISIIYTFDHENLVGLHEQIQSVTIMPCKWIEIGQRSPSCDKSCFMEMVGLVSAPGRYC